ncbi:MAG: hypothetical protein LBS94_00925 [Prevotellaceae bacterium]|jgi:hypothetical protein|nr:hypothetical protein [Prevotellaceae bacterium]
MSDAIIVTIISSSVTLIGIIAGFALNFYTNKKRFDKFANNDTKHFELDPNGPTSKKIDAMAADIGVLKQDMKGVKRYAHTLNGILQDKQVLTNQQAAMLDTHLDS